MPAEDANDLVIVVVAVYSLIKSLFNIVLPDEHKLSYAVKDNNNIMQALYKVLLQTQLSHADILRQIFTSTRDIVTFYYRKRSRHTPNSVSKLLEMHTKVQ